ncbi:MAG: urease accessory protein UreE [Candidatus Methylumidiphilus sp.]
MPKLTEFAPPNTQPARTLTLPYQSRTKSRLLAKLDNGEDIGLFLERGRVLRGGDVLIGPEGLAVAIVAAPEPVSVASTLDALLLARACYHLGNRHIALQIEAGELRYLADHVLDEMLRGLGLAVTQESAPFEPEAGAYSHGH